MTTSRIKPLKLPKPPKLPSYADLHREMAKVPPPAEDELARIAVPWDPARTCQNARPGHFQALGREMKAGQTLAIYYWRLDRFQTDERVLVQWWVLRGRVMDQRNVEAGIKPVEDGLFRRKWNDGDGVTDDDSREYVETEFVRMLTGQSWARNEWTIAVIRRHPVQPGKKGEKK
jgi:hypothetical protein